MARLIIIGAALLAMTITLVPIIMMALPLLSAVAIVALMAVIIWVCIKMPSK